MNVALLVSYAQECTQKPAECAVECHMKQTTDQKGSVLHVYVDLISVLCFISGTYIEHTLNTLTSRNAIGSCFC